MFPSAATVTRNDTPASNMYELQPPARSLTLATAPEVVFEEPEDEAEEAENEAMAFEAMALEARKKADTLRKRRFDGIEIPTTARPANIDKGKQPAVRTANPVAGPSRESGEARKTTGPQYRYQCPAENPATTKAVVDRALDSTMTMTLREAVGVS